MIWGQGQRHEQREARICEIDTYPGESDVPILGRAHVSFENDEIAAWDTSVARPYHRKRRTRGLGREAEKDGLIAATRECVVEDCWGEIRSANMSMSFYWTFHG